MKNKLLTVLMLVLSAFMAIPVLADGVRDANAAYNELLSAFGDKYPDEYAGAYIDASGNKLCVLITERCADTAANRDAAQGKILSHISAEHSNSIYFGTAKYSYNELLAARDTASALLRDKGYGLSFAGIKDDANVVEIGVVPENYAAAADFIKSDSSLKALPLSVVSASIMNTLGESPSAMPQTGSDSGALLAFALLLIGGAMLCAGAILKQHLHA